LTTRTTARPVRPRRPVPDDRPPDPEAVERFDIGHVFRVARRWLTLILAGVVFIVGATVALFRLTPPDYQATTVLLFDQPQLVGGTGGLGAAQKLLELMPTYAELAVSDVVLREVRETLRTDASFATLRSRLVAIPVEGTLTIRITASDPSSRTAEELSRAAAEGLRDQVAALQDRGAVPPEGRYIITVIGSPAASRPARNESRTIVLSAILGAAVMMGIALLLEYVGKDPVPDDA
jgi:capsular polysaccharide biosynthesis protein